MTVDKAKPVVALAAVAASRMTPASSEKFGADLRRVGTLLGLEKLGCTVTEVEPGKRAWPYHNHHANEELFFILEGEGLYRYGDAEHPISAGDFCAAGVGGSETAHQIVNTGATTLRYLAISTRIAPEICEYPESRKFNAFHIGPGQSLATADFKSIGRAEDTLDYWDGEI